MSAAVKARRLLRRPGAWIEASGGGYVVRTGSRGDGVTQTIDEAAYRSLVESPGLKGRRGGGWVLKREPVEDAAVASGRPGVEEGEQAVIQPDGQLSRLRANLTHSPILWLASRRDADGRPWLGRVEIAAARRLEAEAEIALRGPSLTMRWDALPRAGGGSAARVEPGDLAMTASRRVEAALAACGQDRAMVEAVCVNATTLQIAEREAGLKRREGKAVLARGLRALALHYRIG
ncbi:DUF6456 domain-containing protein [Brevundimonas sp. NPDC092305]|uniref:DUF6456 domain-containing protein n=1 Tax=Brevundimonas sp. NPDC092305 TaxID=3363957 RepID=UPI00380A7EC2